MLGWSAPNVEAAGAVADGDGEIECVESVGGPNFRTPNAEIGCGSAWGQKDCVG